MPVDSEAEFAHALARSEVHFRRSHGTQERKHLAHPNNSIRISVLIANLLCGGQETRFAVDRHRFATPYAAPHAMCLCTRTRCTWHSDSMEHLNGRKPNASNTLDFTHRRGDVWMVV
jgi:hypothetical protein